jgi:predicted amidohydrolase YtcJ
VVLRGGIVHTLDAAVPEATAIAIDGDRIVYVGSDAGAAAFIGPETRIEELAGHTVLPGFVDAHTHLASSGTELRDVQLAEATTVQQVQAAVAAGAAASPKAKWVVGGGWDLSAFDGHIDRTQLDAVVADRPVSLDSADGHSIWVNSRALALAHVDASTADPPGGVIVRDEKGQPNGILRENAMTLVTDLLPDYGRAQADAGLADALAEANRFGITTVIDANVEPWALEAYRRREKAGTLTVRVRGAIEEDGPPDAKAMRQALRFRDRYHSDRLAVNAIKLYLDGVIETHTAEMIAPYTDGTNGPPLFTDEALRATMQAFDRQGFQLHAHAIGDGAVRQMLDGLQWLIAEDGPRDRRPLIAHLEVIDPADIPRFASLGAWADFQPLWAFPDSYVRELTWPDIGPERSQWLYPIGAVAAAGGTVVAGSDWSVSSMNPFEGMEVAVTRQDPDQPAEALAPQHAVTAAQILRAYTADAARAAFLEQEVGTLVAGKRADLVVADQDPLAVEPHRISETRVLQTWFDGKAVYTAPGQTL